MAQQSYPTLNGEAQSWANIEVKSTLYDGPSIDLSDIVGLDWDISAERGTQRMTNGAIKAFTRGQSTPTGKISFYADGCVSFIEKLIDIAISKGFVENGEAKYGMIAFDVIIQHTPLGATGIRQVELLGCQVSKDAASYAEGTDADKNDLEIVVKRVVRTINGKKGSLL